LHLIDFISSFDETIMTAYIHSRMRTAIGYHKQAYTARATLCTRVNQNDSN